MSEKASCGAVEEARVRRLAAKVVVPIAFQPLATPKTVPVIEATPEVELEAKRSWLALMLLVVASPVQVSVVLEPPIRAPKPEPERTGGKVRVEVATFANVLGPEKYGMLPVTAAVDVPRPVYVKAPVAEL